MQPGFTLGTKVMRLADNHKGWEIQVYNPTGWETWKDGFDTKAEAMQAKVELEMKAAMSSITQEFRVYESVL